MSPRYKYTVKVIKGEVIDGETTERVAIEAHTIAASKTQAINNIKYRYKVAPEETPMNGYGDYQYTRITAE